MTLVASHLPTAAGIGLKPEHFREILETKPDIGFFEVHAENYMVAGGPFHHYLGLIRAHYPLSIHGVGLSIGGESALDEAHLGRLASLIDRYQPAMFSEHLAWSSHGGAYFSDLLPAPYTAASLQRVCDHVDQVQSHLNRRMLLENPSTYVEFASSTMCEGDFLAEIIRRTGCGLLLDVNNVYVSCINHNRDPLAVLQSMPLGAVDQIHLAGFAEEVDEDGGTLLIDSHGAPVAEAVWRLYEAALQLSGPQPTLIERDNDIPPLPVLLAEAGLAAQFLQSQSTVPPVPTFRATA
ncbi:DUF692 domain-containing protein [Pseudomonas aeruginosa]|jgi:hypothetical protein|uniref:MNIO family bufferin maturase n=1 Tax=Pseudomonadaceae TaxID=135621 RepID=UPI001C3E9D7A|nr:DUF692 domain-containing protein [Pseudomonas aeruginosa]MCS7561378.1 DUF692 domain-containing protein [Pseudomonas aeruginosa]MCS7586149.1 DUF692 domain-containing protein [Pseudomonas aeruginosa]MCS7598956.1 DUF692 domain-containing protein [Pseudomonas aeruginosa]MCS7605603.1 DUF692 domain-containing protein [Pseudomonas aeruginosa]